MLIGSGCLPRKHDGFRFSLEMKGGKKNEVEFQLYVMCEYTGDLLNDSVSLLRRDLQRSSSLIKDRVCLTASGLTES